MTDKRTRTETGRVISSSRDKTITVLVERKVRHPLYKKIMRRSSKLQAHDQENTCNAGDLVIFSGCHLHGTIPNISNKTRFSIDFRILSKDFHKKNIGINIDSKSTGSTVEDFKSSLTGL